MADERMNVSTVVAQLYESIGQLKLENDRLRTEVAALERKRDELREENDAIALKLDRTLARLARIREGHERKGHPPIINYSCFVCDALRSEEKAP